MIPNYNIFYNNWFATSTNIITLITGTPGEITIPNSIVSKVQLRGYWISDQAHSTAITLPAFIDATIGSLQSLIFLAFAAKL